MTAAAECRVGLSLIAIRGRDLDAVVAGLTLLLLIDLADGHRPVETIKCGRRQTYRTP